MASAKEKIELTQDEVNRFEKAFRDPEFRKLFFDYAKELESPESKKQYELEIEQLEAERGMHVEFLHPVPGFSYRTKANGKKYYLNICSNDKMEKPRCERGSSPDGKSGLVWHLPHSTFHPREYRTLRKKPPTTNGSGPVDSSSTSTSNSSLSSTSSSTTATTVSTSESKDSERPCNPQSKSDKSNMDKGNPEDRESSATVLDVLYHPDALRMAETNSRFRELLTSSAVDTIAKLHNIHLDRAKLKSNKAAYMGGEPKPSVIRRKREDFEKKQRELNDLPSDDIKAHVFDGAPYDTTSTEERSKKILSETDSKAQSKSKDNLATKSSPSKLKKSASSGEKPNKIGPDGKLVPEYKIKYRSEIEIEDFSIDIANSNRLVPSSKRPKELTIDIELPGIISAAQISLDVYEREIKLESNRDADPDAQYALTLALTYPVFENDARARFDKHRSVLSVTAPIRPAPLIRPIEDIFPIEEVESAEVQDPGKGTACESTESSSGDAQGSVSKNEEESILKVQAANLDALPSALDSLVISPCRECTESSKTESCEKSESHLASIDENGTSISGGLTSEDFANEAPLTKSQLLTDSKQQLADMPENDSAFSVDDALSNRRASDSSYSSCSSTSSLPASFHTTISNPLEKEGEAERDRGRHSSSPGPEQASGDPVSQSFPSGEHSLQSLVRSKSNLKDPSKPRREKHVSFSDACDVNERDKNSNALKYSSTKATGEEFFNWHLPGCGPPKKRKQKKNGNGKANGNGAGGGKKKGKRTASLSELQLEGECSEENPGDAASKLAQSDSGTAAASHSNSSSSSSSSGDSDSSPSSTPSPLLDSNPGLAANGDLGPGVLKGIGSEGPVFPTVETTVALDSNSNAASLSAPTSKASSENIASGETLWMKTEAAGKTDTKKDVHKPSVALTNSLIFDLD